MLFNDYKREVTNDAIWAIEQGDYDYCKDVCQAIDEMWTDDSITGNGSGSYTFNTWKAQQNVEELIWDESFIWELDAICQDLGELVKQGAETVDVTARCLALSYAIDEIIEAWEEHNNKEEKAS